MIPYAYSVDLWRWSVFSGITTPDKYNTDWWKLRNKHMGVKSPIPRPETEFDPGCYLHIDKNVEFITYFNSKILQYTFHKALCQAAGIEKPIYKCSIYKSKAAGKRLRYVSLPNSRKFKSAQSASHGEESSLVKKYLGIHHHRVEYCTGKDPYRSRYIPGGSDKGVFMRENYQ